MSAAAKRGFFRTLEILRREIEHCINACKCHPPASFSRDPLTQFVQLSELNELRERVRKAELSARRPRRHIPRSAWLATVGFAIGVDFPIASLALLYATRGD
jgi:hypothetical protein